MASLIAAPICGQTLQGLGFSSKTTPRVTCRAWPAILFLLSLPLVVSAQIGWQDMGSTTVLKGSAHASGLSNLVNCSGSTPPPYCVNAGASFNFAGLEQYVEAAQSGAAVDTVHNHMYFTGGGHADYYGNQVYDLNIATKTITRLTDPSPIVNNAMYNSDLTAVSSHTEQGLVYLPNEDAVFKWGIGVGPTPKEQTFGWWITNPRTSPTWVAKTALPVGLPYLVVSGGTGCANGLQTGVFTNGGGTGGTFVVPVVGGVPTGYASLTAFGSGYTSAPTHGTVSTCTGTVTFSGGSISGGQVYEGGGDVGSNCVLDTSAATESVMCINLSSYQLYRYTPSLDTGPGASPSPWTALSSINATEIVTGATCRVHPALKVLVCVGATYGGGGFPSGIYSVSLAAGSSYAATNITSSTSGCSALYSVTNPGFVFDDSTGLFVGYVGTGNSVVLYDYVSQTCVTRTLSGGPTASAYPTPSGTYDRFAYYPKLNQFIAANNAGYDVFSLQLHPNGLGNSTFTCKDIDGDGYGVGPGCRGPDADDSDPTVNTTATVLAKYGDIQTFLEHIGYQNGTSLATVYCVQVGASGGRPSTNADTACTTPYPSWAALPTLRAPYIVIFRAGTWTTGMISPTSGSSSAQNVLMAYPGELPVVDFSGGIIGANINAASLGYLTVDGFKLISNANGTGYLGGTFIQYPSSAPTTSVWDAVYRCEISNSGSDSNVDADNLIRFDFEENVLHDPYSSGGQHNLYLGANTVASSGIAVRRNIMTSVNTGYPNAQLNGRCFSCYMEQNIIEGANGQEVTWLEGVSNSFFRNNLVFNTGNPGSGFRIYNYDSGLCRVSGYSSICPWDQTNNTISNNTFWTGTLSPGSGSAVQGFVIGVINGATAGPCGAGGSPPCGNLGGNFYYNNVIVDLAGTGSVPPVYYPSSNSVNYLALDTWTDNIIQNNSSYSTTVATAAGRALICSAFNSAALNGSGCSTSDPQFVAVSTSYYNSPSSFNFNLPSSSRAFGAGTSNVSIPALDLVGHLRGTPPTLGAYEVP